MVVLWGVLLLLLLGLLLLLRLPSTSWHAPAPVRLDAPFHVGGLEGAGGVTIELAGTTGLLLLLSKGRVGTRHAWLNHVLQKKRENELGLLNN